MSLIKIKQIEPFSASFATSASYSLTASFALNSGGSINSGAFVITASGANDNTTASYALTSSNYVGNSLQLDYLYVLSNAEITGSLSGTSSFSISASHSNTSSFSVTASYITSSKIDGNILSSSYSISSSHSEISTSASYSESSSKSISSSFTYSSSVSNSSSYALTSSYSAGLSNVPNINFGITEMWRNVIHVAKNGTDTRTGISTYSAFTPFLTVQAAINESSVGDVVVIHFGTYEEQITMKNGVDLLGQGATITWPSVGAYLQPTIRIGTNVGCKISGLTIVTNPAGYDTALIINTNYSTVLIEDCVIIASTGAGINVIVQTGTVTFFKCRFRSEFQCMNIGGAIVTINSCLIDFPSANWGSQGIGVFSGAKAVIIDTHVTMIGNSDGSVLNIGYNNVNLQMSNCVLSGQCSRMVYLFTTNSAMSVVFDGVRFLSTTAPATFLRESDTDGKISLVNCSGNKPLSSGISAITYPTLDYLENSSL